MNGSSNLKIFNGTQPLQCRGLLLLILSDCPCANDFEKLVFFTIFFKFKYFIKKIGIMLWILINFYNAECSTSCPFGRLVCPTLARIHWWEPHHYTSLGPTQIPYSILILITPDLFFGWDQMSQGKNFLKNLTYW